MAVQTASGGQVMPGPRRIFSNFEGPVVAGKRSLGAATGATGDSNIYMWSGNALVPALALEGHIKAGNGTAPNLRGVNNLSGINSQAMGIDPIFDAILKAMVLCQTVGFADPDAVVMHPTDWQDARLRRTADGIYILGNPSDAAPARLQGLPVITTTHQTQNTAVVGAFRMHGELCIRRGIEVQVSNSHSDYFVNGKQAIRVDMRAALIFDRPAAFCLVTGV